MIYWLTFLTRIKIFYYIFHWTTWHLIATLWTLVFSFIYWESVSARTSLVPHSKNYNTDSGDKHVHYMGRFSAACLTLSNSHISLYFCLSDIQSERMRNWKTERQRVLLKYIHRFSLRLVFCSLPFFCSHFFFPLASSSSSFC